MDIQEFLAENGTLLAITVGCIIVLTVVFKVLNSSNDQERNDEGSQEGLEDEDKQTSKNNGHHKSVKAARERPNYRAKHQQSSSNSAVSPCVIASLKGHGQTISDFDLSPNGCMVASTAPDRAIFLWTFDDLEHREKQFSRVNVELDEAIHLSFSPDSKAFVTSLRSANELQVWKVHKKQPETHPVKMTATPFVKYETNTGTSCLVGCSVSASGKFIATFTDESVLKIWSLKGQLLISLDTHQGHGSGMAISPSGYLVGTYGFTSEVLVHEVVFDRNGNFVDMKRAFQIGGHKTSVVSTAFDRESHRMVSVSKDGVWRLFDINVEFRLGQDPKLLCHGELPKDAVDTNLLAIVPAISIHSVLIATKQSLYTFDGEASETSAPLVRVDELGSTGNVNHMKLDPTGEYALLSLGRAIIVSLLFGELHLRLKAAKQSLRSAKGALADRLAQKISTLTSRLVAINEP